MSKPLRTLTTEESKISFKGKTLIRKSTDSDETIREFNKKIISGDIKLLYVNDIDNVINFVYEILRK